MGKRRTKMKGQTVIVIAIVVGVAITLASGLFSNTPSGLLGAVHFGYPLPWLHQVVYPNAPLEVDALILLVDAVIWTVIAGLILFLIESIRRR